MNPSPIRRACQMTSAELAARRADPLHVQTMARRSNLDPAACVVSDLEEFSAEALALSVSELRAGGWWCSGPAFIRTRPAS